MALFNRLESMFGKRWQDQFTSEKQMQAAMAEWGIGLYGLTGAQIKRGIDETRKSCKWPPSIAEFRDLALGVGECWEHKGAAYRCVKALPKPERKPKAGFFAEFRKGLVIG